MNGHEGFYTDRFQDVIHFFRGEETPQQALFLEQFIPLKQGDRVLDLGCGWGRVTLELAQRGFAMTGMDQSEDFIRQATERARKLDIKAEFRRQDMRTLQDEGQFDAVISFSTSLTFYDDATHLDILRRAARALRSGGKFLYDQGSFEYLQRHPLAGGKRKFSDGRVYETVYTTDPVNRVITRRSVLLQGQERVETGWSLKFYALPRITEMLTQAGMAVVRSCGGYDGSALRDTSERIVLLVQKG